MFGYQFRLSSTLYFYLSDFSHVTRTFHITPTSIFTRVGADPEYEIERFSKR